LFSITHKRLSPDIFFVGSELKIDFPSEHSARSCC